jgi:hypothetical protein
LKKHEYRGVFIIPFNHVYDDKNDGTKLPIYKGTKRENKKQRLAYIDLNHMNGHQFEDLIEQLVKKMGFVVEERKLTADGGIDLLAHSFEPVFEGKYIIQCKRYVNKISESPIRDLYGVVHSRNANKGILITNSTFTKAARDFANGKQLELIDGVKLSKLLSRYKIGGISNNSTMCDSAFYLIHSFLPLIRKAKESYDEMRKDYSYSYNEKTIVNLEEWNILVKKIQENSREFYDWWIRICFAELVPALKEKPMNLQKVMEINQRMTKGLQVFVKQCSSYFRTVPLNSQNNSHLRQSRLLFFIDAVFRAIFHCIKELEYYEDLTEDQLKKSINKKGDIVVHFYAPFPDNYLF